MKWITEGFVTIRRTYKIEVEADDEMKARTKFLNWLKNSPRKSHTEETVEAEYFCGAVRVEDPPLAKVCSRCGGADSDPNVGPVNEVAPGLLSCSDCEYDVADAALEREEQSNECPSCGGEGTRGNFRCRGCGGSGERS